MLAMAPDHRGFEWWLCPSCWSGAADSSEPTTASKTARTTTAEPELPGLSAADSQPPKFGGAPQPPAIAHVRESSTDDIEPMSKVRLHSLSEPERAQAWRTLGYCAYSKQWAQEERERVAASSVRESMPSEAVDAPEQLGLAGGGVR